MRARHSQFLASSSKRKIVFDRSVSEDFAVFCQMHRQSGRLDAAATVRLGTLAAALEADLPTPDLIIYFSVEEAVLRRRISIVGHPNLIVESLSTQLCLYDEWIASRSESVLLIDNSRCRSGLLGELLFGDSEC